MAKNRIKKTEFTINPIVFFVDFGSLNPFKASIKPTIDKKTITSTVNPKIKESMLLEK
ncbi:hypothetical protein IRZ71_07575 [Flavobacterium sp. ANB]|uniref:hypothetical protein n=1 Tax=unclassified Flavobacterium TaxID=196869 RepID=UPI0012B9B5D1|nr:MULTISPECIES: hypothetical protein [unclassified Flavobacterium]MBF4516195.1 hypothetical protein [Flavobacterium sp. ANB]MTD69908.1 hypothetical protein [Flavobacterium sp. LC2016-13]